MSGLLRSLFFINKPTRFSRAGFVLPTTVLLLLMVTLTAGALSFRTFSRTQSVIAQREQEVILGAATPAIDRAKSKIEYLFSKDIRLPGGLPTSNKIQAMMRNVSNDEPGGSANTPLPGGPVGIDPETLPPYTLPDETRLDLNSDDILDNAWSFPTDIDGDGTASANELIVYSVIMDDAQGDPADPGNPDRVKRINDAVSNEKAKALVSRNASIDTAAQGNTCPKPDDATGLADRGVNSPGWEALDSVTLLKNFQIDVFVINDNLANRTVSTLEFQQVRQAIRGNKWGAWFKNDIELFPDAGFVWNGAMHTEGSIFLGDSPRLNMVSAYASCLYPDATASDITLAKTDAGFTGQFVTGKIGNGSLTGAGGATTVDWFASLTSTGQTILRANGEDDSVASKSGMTATTADVALNPIQMFTADESEHNNKATWERPEAWDRSNLTAPTGDTNIPRVSNQNESTPFLDDLYRADNRYGPKAAYTSNFGLKDANDGNGVSIGTGMRTPAIAATASTPAVAATPGPSELIDPVQGLDGYWERQAINEGLRIIGGQRLELGNNTGWRGNQDATAPSGPIDNEEMDPLYNEALSFNTTSSGSTDKSMRLHRLSLRDNLAAVQSMAVYHANGAGAGTFPMMCMSMASHPGTPKTIERSTSFNNATSTSSSEMEIDFFHGFGTNGWEYAPPLDNETAFANAYDNVTPTSLKKALRNLAYFAGDPLGGAPSFTPVQDDHIHPYPIFSMWGDFSHLRRLVDATAPNNLASVAYADLSPADQAYLHTASCTLGMLADNIRTVEEFSLSSDDLNDIAAAIGAITVPFVGGASSDENSFLLQSSPHVYLSRIEAEADTELKKNVARLARIFHLKNQILRDRRFGFAKSNTFDYTLDSTQTLTDNTAPNQNGQKIPADIASLGIDYTAATGNNFFGLGDPTGDAATELKFLRLAALAGGIDHSGSTNNAGQPKFPALFYLFPMENHDHLGTGSTLQPLYEPYIDDRIDSIDADTDPDQYVIDNDPTPDTPSSSTYAYQVIDSVNPEDVSNIALTRKTADAASWVSPYVTPSTTAPNISPNIITVEGTDKAILLLDKGFMDGREMLSTKSIDLDVALATSAAEAVATITVTATTPAVTVTWIPPNSQNAIGGIVYAFREDAKREDSIVRPRRAVLGTAEEAWTTCADNIIAADCLMSFSFGSAYDPPLRRTTGNDNNYISPKPVDYFVDPMRRPYGFRLSNGSTLNRPASVSAGLSFISDNPVFIKGDFNLHLSSGVTQEEFTTALTANYSNFYTRTGENVKYGNAAQDSWRPVEVVGDSVGILSDRWNDGAISDTFMLARAPFSDGAESSYQNHLRPLGNGSGEFAGLMPADIGNPSRFGENPYDGDNGGENSPVRVWRDGEFSGAAVNGDPLTNNLMTLTTNNLNDRRKRDRIRAQQTTINALL
ncbi:MAG: hormogonium polysaccharide biosynthesis protein HpsA, partial [Phormidesmis sp.]